MRKYIVDQCLFLAVGIMIMIFIPLFCGPVFTVALESVAVICWGYLCRRILLLPFDLLIGKVTQSGYFSCQCNMEDLEFFKGTGCCEWKFYFASNQPLRLLVPIAIKMGGECRISRPEKDVKLRVTYYRLSMILLHLSSAALTVRIW